MTDSIKVKKYFEDSAKDFDDIYDNQGAVLTRLINKAFRKGMYERANLAVEECGDVSNKSILDVGCGSGRIALALAQKEARVVGIDYSSKMIELANKHLTEFEVNTSVKLNIEFICCDFMEDFNNGELFDIVLALGVFDYIEDPRPLLKKMRNLAKEQLIASYPAKFAFQMPIRKAWLYMKNCPVYFYTEQKLATVYESVGLNNYKIMKIPALYLVKSLV